MVDRVVIIGDGGHARVLAESVGTEAVLAGHLAPAGSDRAHELLGPRLGDDTQIRSLGRSGMRLVVGLGSVDRRTIGRRRDVLALVEADAHATIVHRSAHVSSWATVAPGTFVAAGAIIGVGTRVGCGSIVNTGAIVDHDCDIGDNVHIAPGAVISGGVSIGSNSLVGVGSSIRQGIAIGPDAVIGAGSVVVHDVAAGATVFGVPARQQHRGFACTS